MFDIVGRFKKKPEWGIASILSLIYVFAYVLLVNGKIPNVLLFGFCVWGKYDGEDPNLKGTFPEDNCTDFADNSHWVAFIIDTIMTALPVLFYFLDKSDDKDKNWIYYAAMTFIIFIHGGLHWFLQQKAIQPVFNCFVDPVPPVALRYGTIFFLVFTFFLSFIIISSGSGKLKASTFVISAILALAVEQISTLDGDKYALQALFVVIHPVACIVGLLSETRAYSSTLMANLFSVCTIVGIIEILWCEAILRPLGGHFWYDVTMHATVLASLPYFWPPVPPETKKD